MVQTSKRRAAAAHPRPARSPRHAARQQRPIDTLLNPAVFKALSDPTRLRLLACLAKCARPCSVGEVGECCAVDLSVVSRHLAALEVAGVLEGTKQGRSVLYRVRFGRLSGMLRALADAIDSCCPGGACGADAGGCGCAAPAGPPAAKSR